MIPDSIDKQHFHMEVAMRSTFALIIFMLVFAQAQASPSRANEQDKSLQSPASTQQDFEARLSEARERYERNPNDPDAIVWLGRRTAYLGRYQEAIDIYTRGIEKHPRYAELYRHRGHRYITLRRFDKAISDFETAARLVKRKQDQVEPDGMPNARSIPTSTLKTNIYYHLGLAHYLRGDFKSALKSYRECMKHSKNPDMLVATSHWLYMTLRRMNRGSEAARVLNAISKDMDVIENHDYHRLLLMYKGLLTPEGLLDEAAKATALGSATVGYGVGNWYLYNGERAKAVEIFKRVLEGEQKAAFGYIAAEAEMKRLGK